MALIGSPFDNTPELNYDSGNPEYTINDFKFWIPAVSTLLDTDDGQTAYDNLYPIANAKILYSVFGVDWKYAMSLCIAHYMVIIGKQNQTTGASTMSDFAATSATDLILSGASVGGFSKSFDMDHSLSNTADARWWNSSKWGQILYNLYQSKPILTMLVVTSGPVVTPQRKKKVFW